MIKTTKPIEKFKLPLWKKIHIPLELKDEFIKEFHLSNSSVLSNFFLQGVSVNNERKDGIRIIIRDDFDAELVREFLIDHGVKSFEVPFKGDLIKLNF